MTRSKCFLSLSVLLVACGGAAPTEGGDNLPDPTVASGSQVEDAAPSPTSPDAGSMSDPVAPVQVEAGAPETSLADMSEAGTHSEVDAHVVPEAATAPTSTPEAGVPADCCAQCLQQANTCGATPSCSAVYEVCAMTSCRNTCPPL